MDYIQAMFRAYKSYLRNNDVRPPSRQTFSVLIYQLKSVGAIRFVKAEVPGWGEFEEGDLTSSYRPQCGSPAPRHYYRIINAQNPGFLRPDAEFRKSRGLPVPQALPRVPGPKQKVKPEPKPKKVKAAPVAVAEGKKLAVPRKPKEEILVKFNLELENITRLAAQAEEGRVIPGFQQVQLKSSALAAEIAQASRTAKGGMRESLNNLHQRITTIVGYAELTRIQLEAAGKEKLPRLIEQRERSYQNALALLKGALAE